jgi:branched-subunit amino acid permease
MDKGFRTVDAVALLTFCGIIAQSRRENATVGTIKPRRPASSFHLEAAVNDVPASRIALDRQAHFLAW